MHLNGKTVKMIFEGKTCRKWANEPKIHDSEKIWIPGGQSAPAPGQYMCITLIFKDV